MAWETVVGHERVKDLLRRSLERRQLSHAYLFYGIRGVGKQAMAIEFAKALLCRNGGTEACGECASCRKVATLHHPDLNIVVPLPRGKDEESGDDPLDTLDFDQIESIKQQFAQKAKDAYYEIQIPKANFIKINSVRDLKRSAALTSVEGSWKVFLIFDADKMNAESSNSLLKILEEPSENTLIVLTTSEKDSLLPTIISRCQLVQFTRLSDDEIASMLRERDEVPAEEAALIARLAQGSYAVARELRAENLTEDKKTMVDFIRIAVGWNKISRVELIDQLGSTRDRVKVEQWLNILQTWLRDALVVRTGALNDTIGRQDSDELGRFVQRFPHANLEEAIEAVERSITSVRRNAHLHLLLTTLSFDLKKSLGTVDS